MDESDPDNWPPTSADEMAVFSAGYAARFNDELSKSNPHVPANGGSDRRYAVLWYMGWDKRNEEARTFKDAPATRERGGIAGTERRPRLMIRREF